MRSSTSRRCASTARGRPISSCRIPGFPDPFAGGDVDRAAVEPVSAGGGPDAATNAAHQRRRRADDRQVRARERRLQLRARLGSVPRPTTSTRRSPTAAGPIRAGATSRRSSRRRARQAHIVNTGFNLNLPWHRTFLFVNYTLARAMNDTDGAFSLPVNSFDPRAEWGPSPIDVRHRLSGMFNMNLWKGFKLATNFNGNSAPPYNITTGRDDNNDTVSNDRPAGVGRNARAGVGPLGSRRATELHVRLRPAAGADGAGGPQIVMIRAGGGGDTPMGGFSRRRRRQALAHRALRGRHEHPQPHEPPRLQRRDDVAVLRRADVGAGAEARGAGAGRRRVRGTS